MTEEEYEEKNREDDEHYDTMQLLAINEIGREMTPGQYEKVDRKLNDSYGLVSEPDIRDVIRKNCRY